MTRFAKRAAALVLVLVLLCLPVSASGASPESVSRADRLASLHVFRGTGTNEDGTPIYSLDRQPTRLQGLIMLIRLLGLEETALSYDGPNPFRDMTGEFVPLVSYAYQNGITNGTSADTFEPGGRLSPLAYITFLLRALGYTEAAGDFTWGSQPALAASLGMMTERTAALITGVTMNRGDLVDLSYAALTCRMKDGPRTLAEKLSEDGVFTWSEGVAANVLGDSAGWTLDYVPYTAPAPVETPTPSTSSANAVVYEKKTVNGLTAHVITVDAANPAVQVKAAMVDNKLNHTAAFSQIVKNSGAAAVINGNFFNSYSQFKTPIGHVMVNGQFLFGNSGISSLGITRDGQVRMGRPSVFTRLRSGGKEWSIYEINTADQDSTASVLYTPAYGNSVTFKNGGYALTVSGGAVQNYTSVTAGTSLSIPADGYVAYMGTGYAGTDYFRTPVAGETVTMEYYLMREDPEGFSLEGVESIISGAPRLVQDGQIVTTLETGFTEERFTTAVSPRTAVGIDRSGKLLMVCVPGGAKIQQMRELMQALGCVDAVNLDGGASCGMYYDGNYIATPGRELTVTLQVFVNG